MTKASPGPGRERLHDLWRMAGRRLYMSISQQQRVVSAFGRAYAASPTACRWMGHTATTTPLDLWVYQEVVHQTRPEVIIATTPNARYLADLCRITGSGRVLWVRPESDRGERGSEWLEILSGPALKPGTFARVAGMARSKRSVQVVLGSGGEPADLPDELRLYSTLVTRGNFLIVEDTHSRGDDAGRARGAAVADFLGQNKSFVADRTREKFYLTFNPGGYLNRIR